MIKQIVAIQVHQKANTVVLQEIWRAKLFFPFFFAITCNAENVHARVGKHCLQQGKETNANIRQRNGDVNNVYVLSQFTTWFWRNCIGFLHLKVHANIKKVEKHGKCPFFSRFCGSVPMFWVQALTQTRTWPLKPTCWRMVDKSGHGGEGISVKRQRGATSTLKRRKKAVLGWTVGLLTLLGVKRILTNHTWIAKCLAKWLCVQFC